MSREAAERESSAAGAYGSYLQRSVGATVVKTADNEDALDEKAKRTRYVVDEDEEVDDEAMLKRFRSTLDVDSVQVKKDAGRRKKRKGHEKMKAHQQMEKIEKIMEEKKKDGDE